MKKPLFLLTLIFCATISFAQKAPVTVKGQLADTVYLESMVAASISILHSRDSSLAASAIAGDKGAFEIKNVAPGSYRLLITFQGYVNYTKNIVIDESSSNLGTIYMERVSTLLDEVIVERPPVTIKKDTVEFNAGSFKTKDNATAEDLLKKLPGMQVDRDGKVKAQGEEIKKIYVNGKEFFGNDPKMATKNITADMIESVQVYDDMSDQAKFTRIDDGSRAKTINIKLKKGRDNGYFGMASAGVGNDGRYDANLSINKFNSDQNISLIGSSNNLSQQGFSLPNGISFGGISMARPATGGGGGGISKSNSAGLNYYGKLGSKTDISGSYDFTGSDKATEQSSVQQSFFANDSLAIQARDNLSSNNSRGHRFNLKAEIEIDSMNSILYAPNFSWQNTQSGTFDSTFTRATGKTSDYLAIEGKTQNNNTSEALTLTNNFLYRRRFNKAGRTFTLGYNNTITNNDGNGFNLSPLTFYNPDGTVASTLNQNLQNNQKTRGKNNLISSSYTEPLAKDQVIEINYAYTNNHNTSDRKAFNFNNASGKFDQVNPAQTNYLENDYVTSRMGVNYRIQKEKYSMQAGGSLQSSSLSNRSILATTGKDTTYKQRFTNFAPTINFTYGESAMKSMRISYQGRPNAPSITQLQEVPDVTNPLQIVTGNRNLKQEFNNSISIGYNSFNLTNFRMFMANIEVANTMNKIISSIDTVSRGIQLIRPENTNGSYRTSSFLTIGFPIKGMKGSSLNFSNNASYNHDLSLLYKQKNATNTWMISQSAGANLDIKEKLNLGINATIAYNNTKYTQKSSGAQDQQYFTQTYFTDINYTFLKSYVLSTDFNYYINTGRSDGFNQSIPLWNAGIARKFFKNSNGELRFSVNDILNKNQSITRTVTDNYITDTRSNVQKRFFMLKFTYNLSRMGGKSAQPVRIPRGMMPASGNRMIMGM